MASPDRSRGPLIGAFNAVAVHAAVTVRSQSESNATQRDPRKPMRAILIIGGRRPRTPEQLFLTIFGGMQAQYALESKCFSPNVTPFGVMSFM